MITEKSRRHDFKSMSLMADQNNKTEFKSNGYKISQDNLDQINYNNLINSYTCENAHEVNQYIDILEKAGRQDLLNQFYRFRDKFEEEKQEKLDKPFMDAIGNIIDLSKVNPEVVPYLLCVEKRLQKLEAMFEKTL